MASRMLGAVALSVLLAACGGGGGGGSAGDASVTYTPTNLTATAFQGQQLGVNAFQDPSVTVTAAVTGNLSGTVVAVVQDTGTAFTGSPINVVHTGLGYQATLKPNVALAPGTYTGNLRLHLCKDLACSQEYSVLGASLPYTVTILPRLQITVSIDAGAPLGTQQSGAGSLPVTIQSTHVLKIHSNRPVTMQFSSGLGLPTVTGVTSTGTDWQGTITLKPMGMNQLMMSAVPQAPMLGVEQSADINLTVTP